MGVIIIFASPRFSPIPYYPSNHQDLQLIIKALDLKSNRTVIDLGAGDGFVIFAAAGQAFGKKLNTRFIAVDINPVLVGIMHLRRLFHPNRRNIKIIWADFFKTNLSQMLSLNSELKILNATFYLYISPWFLEKTLSIIKLLPKEKRIVSYFYPIKTLKPMTHIIGIHNLYTYKV